MKFSRGIQVILRTRCQGVRIEQERAESFGKCVDIDSMLGHVVFEVNYKLAIVPLQVNLFSIPKSICARYQ